MDVMQSGRASSHYTGLPIEDDICTKTMRIYPSHTMEDEYRTSSPLVATIVAAFIFLFTTLVFLVYDCIVARRQKIVLGRALASGAIVNSLFPEKVRKELYRERQVEQEQEHKQAEFLRKNEKTAPSHRPIAHMHENTTIL